MEKKVVEVAIIGAGCAGLSLSRILDYKGIDHITLESCSETANYGNRVISKETNRKLELTSDDILYDIREINFYSPSETLIETKFSYDRGYVVNLGDVERVLYANVPEKNKIHLSERVLSIDVPTGTIITNKSIINAKIIVVASGATRKGFRNSLGVSEPRNVLCLAHEIEASDITSTILDNEIAPGFYGWIIPLGENKIEIGFGTDDLGKIKKEGFSKLLYSLPHIKKYSKSHVLRSNGGFIPLSPINNRCGDNWIIIGDAAGGEPVLGGSIHKSLDEASLSAEVIDQYLSNKISSLRPYEYSWRNRFGNDIDTQRDIRSALDISSNQMIDTVFKRINGKNLEADGLINNLFANIVSELISMTNQYK